MPRIFSPTPLCSNQTLVLRDAAARHVQVLRLQPGDALRLFDGSAAPGGEFEATVLRMGRADVELLVGAHHAVEREAARAVHLAVGMPANERMDWLVEKATELGVASIQPLITERSVLRLSGERATKKQAHWQGIAVAACEQCGRNQLPRVHPVLHLGDWLGQRLPQAGTPALPAWVLSLRAQVRPWQQLQAATGPVLLLSGPEGGLSPAEEDLALAQGVLPC
ncbi:MAG: hypothetical protein RLZZ401_1038, partial [Pseudomonadota bacterium]